MTVDPETAQAGACGSADRWIFFNKQTGNFGGICNNRRSPLEESRSLELPGRAEHTGVRPGLPTRLLCPLSTQLPF